MLKTLSLFLAALTLTVQISAQCTGVYFKENTRQAFSKAFMASIVKDFDNDGLRDVFGYSKTNDTTFEVNYYKRLSANSFDTTANTSTITNVIGNFGVVGDVNGDGKKDLIVSRQNALAQITTYLNDGSGRFLTNTPNAAMLSADEVLLVSDDLNGDGKADVISTIQGQSTSNLYYRLAQADNSFGNAVLLTTFSFYIRWANIQLLPDSSIIIEDLNNDGLKDIAFHTSTDLKLRVLTNTGNLNFDLTTIDNFPLYTWKNIKLSTFDVNNDGKKEFISNWYNSVTSKVKLLVNNGNNIFTENEITIPAKFAQLNSLGSDTLTGDFDNDGDKDVIIPGKKDYLLLKNQGNSTFTQQEFKTFLTIDGVENLDADGKADGLTINRPFLEGYVNYMNTNTLFYLYKTVSFRKNQCNPIGQTKTVDFDGDGFTDTAFWNPQTGVWRYYTNTANGTQTTFQFGNGSLGDVPVPNDYDGDGKTDYAVYRASTGSWNIMRSSDQQLYAVNFGVSEDKPVPADYDGDGKADIAVFRPSTGDWHFLFSETNQYSGIHFGISEDKPIPADFDGDGKADINVFRPSTGDWYRFNSSDLSFVGIRFGIGTDKLLPADYDSDGKADIAVVRNGTWYILKNDFSIGVFNWGSPTDTLFVGQDYHFLTYAYRKSSNTMFSTDFPSGLNVFNFYSTGNSANEKLVSSLIPVE